MNEAESPNPHKPIKLRLARLNGKVFVLSRNRTLGLLLAKAERAERGKRHP